jgi:hypothetical protein
MEWVEGRNTAQHLQGPQSPTECHAVAMVQGPSTLTGGLGPANLPAFL